MTAPVDIGTLIVSTPGTLGGRPRIADTRLPVATIAIAWQQGHTPEEMVDELFGGVSLAGIHAALAYYFANREAIDASIAEEDAAFQEGLKEQAMRDPALARLLEDDPSAPSA
jgi:uncharacterized protein (DUF433 family)